MDVRRMVITNRDSSPLCWDCAGQCCRTFILYSGTHTTEREKIWIKSEIEVIHETEGDEEPRYKCKLLDSKTGRCGDYDNRPSVCRKYPYNIVSGKSSKPAYETACMLANYLCSLLKLNSQDVKLRENGHSQKG